MTPRPASAKSTPGRKRITYPDVTTYSGRVAARLNELRTKNGLSVQELAELLRKEGHQVSLSAMYGYEVGRNGHGSAGFDLPVDFYPAIAKIFGMTVRSFLPPR